MRTTAVESFSKHVYTFLLNIYLEVAMGDRCLCISLVLMCGEGNGNPLQYSCLENSMDRGGWWAAVHGVAQSWTRLKWLSIRAYIGEGNGNPLQYSCLENPRDSRAWWAAVFGATQSRTRLKRLSSSSSSVNVIDTAKAFTEWSYQFTPLLAVCTHSCCSYPHHHLIILKIFFTLAVLEDVHQWFLMYYE